jgi:glycogen(starch) synthase
MKVLITTIFAYPPRGGLGKYIQELKTGLEQNGHQVDILARHHDQYCLTRSNRQIPLSSRKSGRRGAPLLPTGWDQGNQAQKYLKNIRDEAMKFFDAVQSIKLSQYQIIHTQDIISASVLRVYKPGLTPLVLTVHGCVTAEYYYNGYIKPRSAGWKVLSSFESLVIQQCERTIVPSRWLLDVYKKCQISTGNMEVISNGIDIPTFQKQMNQKTGLKSPANKTIMICTGRLEKVKGQHILLDALARLKKDRKDWVCWIVGKGSAERDLKKKSRRLGLVGFVKFLGRRDDIPALLKQAHIYIIPSLQENYPYSLVEAQVAGKAIIASRTGGIPEIVKHEKNGLLFQVGQSRKLYQQVNKLLKKPDLKVRLGNEAKAGGRSHFSLDTMMKQVMNVYKNALKSSTTDKGEG